MREGGRERASEKESESERKGEGGREERGRGGERERGADVVSLAELDASPLCSVCNEFVLLRSLEVEVRIPRCRRHPGGWRERERDRERKRALRAVDVTLCEAAAASA